MEKTRCESFIGTGGKINQAAGILNLQTGHFYWVGTTMKDNKGSVWGGQKRMNQPQERSIKIVWIYQDDL